MRIIVHAKPRAGIEKVEKVDESNFVVSVKAPPVQGKANEAIITLLSEYFNVSKTRIRILNGFTSRRKTIEVKGL